MILHIIHFTFDASSEHPNPLGKHLCREGDCAPSEGVVSPPSKLKDLTTTEDNPCEPETQEVGYPEIEDICRVLQIPLQ